MFVGILVVAPADGGAATLFALPLAALGGLMVLGIKDDRKFLLRLFFAGLLVRMLVGTLIYVFHLQEFFGGDALTYDFFGDALLRTWNGEKYYQSMVDLFTGGGASSGWGMLYIVAAIYKVIGRNMLATQYVNAVLGAATAPITYLIALEIFPNKRMARTCALLSAFFPSMVLWSAQGLKDGPIVFLLAVSMLATLKLGERLSVKHLSALALALAALMPLRFYVFYIVVISVTVAFILGRRPLSAKTFVRQFIILITIALALAYFGVSRYASAQFESYGSLERLQTMRLDAAKSAQSGFGEDVDVSTPGGALSAIPLGFSYLLFAPFPWQFGSLRALITLPEMIVWWCCIPLLVLGLWFTIKYRVRQVAPILIFMVLLTLTYSVLQGNVGTAYRQRAQLLIFYFVFVAVGFVLMKEKREEVLRRREAQKEENNASRRRPRWQPDARADADQMPVEG
jgi:4-amino-4-deoxy-L-arabinose transferase-like glycosyltransferase